MIPATATAAACSSAATLAMKASVAITSRMAIKRTVWNALLLKSPEAMFFQLLVTNI